MGKGIVVCGLNGSGKSTLGRALAEKIHGRFFDNEDFYFPKTDPAYLYSSPRTKEEAAELLFCAVKEAADADENFVLASVKGDYGAAFLPFFHYVVWLEVPKEVRLRRVRARSFQKFGARIMPGGDLWEQEEEFFHFVEARPEDTVAKWIDTVTCPGIRIIRADGTRPIEENAAFLLRQMRLP